MIDAIAWFYFEDGTHLVTFINGNEKQMTSAEIIQTFSLGNLKRVV